jgi:hypothetical protein
VAAAVNIVTKVEGRADAAFDGQDHSEKVDL